MSISVEEDTEPLRDWEAIHFQKSAVVVQLEAVISYVEVKALLSNS